MAHLNEGERTYVKSNQEYGQKLRTLLGLQDSAVIQSDLGVYLGFTGEEARAELVSAVTKKNGLDVTETIPTDFRTIGIAVMTSFGIPAEEQIKMFTNFMKDFTKQQRDTYVAQYDALDKNDPVAVQAFVTSMTSLLSY